LLSVSEGGEPTARDLSAINASITSGAISLYLENTQNITPAVAAQVDLARSMTPPIPIVEMTETPPRSQTFAEWQTAQLTELVAALKKVRP
jgi:zinc/manganese transport system substrate-binding protein